MSNINVTPGSGKIVGTETIGGVDYGLVKIIDGTAGATTQLAFVGGALPVSVLGTLTVGSHPVTLAGGYSSVSGLVNIGSIAGSHTLYAQPDSYVLGTTSIITGITAVSVLSAPGASFRNFITHITVTNGSATATYVNIKDSGASIMYSGYAAASGGGFASSFPVPLRQWSTNASVDVISTAQASITAAISGFKAA